MISPARNVASQRRPRVQAVPVAPTDAPPPFDLSRLRRFTLGNIELEREIIGLFASQAPIMMDALVKARTETEWRDATHTLKGSSASVGAWLIAEAAARSEGLAKKPAEWVTAIREIASAMHASLTYLAQVQAAHIVDHIVMAAAE
jgi:HPt (histidine-containing phosphotransfer) domain-containing protein